MRKRGSLTIVLVTIACVVINLLCKYVAQTGNWPFWFDSLGTMIMAYVLGPICGSLVGVASNIIYGFFVDEQSIYFIVSIIIGVIVGVAAKKKVFNTFFGVMNMGMLLAMVCSVVSTGLALFYYHCLTGNLWGDQMCEMLDSMGMNHALSVFIGTFYVEFLDKFITVLLVFYLIRLVRYYRNSAGSKPGNKKNVTNIIIVALAVSALMSMHGMAAEDEEDDSNYEVYSQSVYNDADGLTSGEANCIAQTKDGVLWIGTYAGLYSYDGIGFVLHSEFPTIKNVNHLFVDEEGRMWVGTNDQGLSIIINGEVVNTLDDRDGLPSNAVRSINCDTNGNYYIGTSAGMAVVNLNGGVLIKDTIDDIVFATSIAADDVGNVAVVNDAGTLFIIHDGQIYFEEECDLDGENFESVFFNDDGLLFVGTSGDNIMVYKLTTSGIKKEARYTCDGLNMISSMSRVESGEIFVCSYSGIGYLDKSYDFHLIATSSTINSVENAIEDYQGNIWFSSSRIGLLKLCDAPFKELFTDLGFEDDVVNSVTKWQGMMLYGTDHGLNAVNLARGKAVKNDFTNQFDGIRIRNLQVDSNDNLWISTTGEGLHCITPDYKDADNHTAFNSSNGAKSDRFRSIIETKNGEIWASSDDGIVIIKDQNIEATIGSEEGLTLTRILCLIEGENGDIYAGSDGGGLYVIRDREVVDVITRDDGLSSGVVLRIVKARNELGYFIVTSNGICYMEGDNVMLLEQFPYSNNYDIAIDEKGTMWVLGSAGVYLADETKLVNGESQDYVLLNNRAGLRMGLTANAWNYLDDNGDLYLCGDRGVCRVNVKHYEDGENAYRFLLKNITVDGRKYEINKSDVLELPSDASRIEIEPVILNYSLNDPYVRYYLEGYDQEPTTILSSQLEKITYTNLPRGRYTFKFAVLDERMNKEIESSKYTFNITMKMYQKWWYKLYVIVIAGMVIIWTTWFFTKKKAQRTLDSQKLQLEYASKQIEMGNETILSIARTVDAKDSNTSQHSFRVSEYSVAIAKKYGFSEDRCENLRKMALLHDIGKIGIPDAILNKPAKLTDEEYAVMKTHVTRGGEILKDFTLIENVALGAMYHHERYDGTGYAHGLKGEDIPIEARIIGIADAFDAMTANRVYRKQLDLDYVISEVKRCSGTQFDPKLVDILLTLIDDGSIDVEALYGKSKEEE